MCMCTWTWTWPFVATSGRVSSFILWTGHSFLEHDASSSSSSRRAQRTGFFFLAEALSVVCYRFGIRCWWLMIDESRVESSRVELHYWWPALLHFIRPRSNQSPSWSSSFRHNDDYYYFRMLLCCCCCCAGEKVAAAGMGAGPSGSHRNKFSGDWVVVDEWIRTESSQSQTAADGNSMDTCLTSIAIAIAAGTWTWTGHSSHTVR